MNITKTRVVINKTVAAEYLALVNDPFAGAKNPGFDDIIWSTLTNWPGVKSVGIEFGLEPVSFSRDAL